MVIVGRAGTGKNDAGLPRRTCKRSLRRDSRGSGTDCGENVGYALASGRRRYPRDGPVWIGERVEGESESTRGQNERQGQPPFVARMLRDVEPDNEVTEHRSLEADAEEQPPLRVPTTWREERPACLDVAARLALEHASEVEHITPALRFDPECNGEAVFRVAVGDDRRNAWERVTREFLQSATQPLRLQLSEALGHDLHHSPPSGRHHVTPRVRRVATADP